MKCFVKINILIFSSIFLFSCSNYWNVKKGLVDEYGLSTYNGTTSLYGQVFNLTCGSGCGDEAPNYNLFIPPKVDSGFQLIKGMINESEKINYKSSTKDEKSFSALSTSNSSSSNYYSSDYNYAKIDAWYIEPSDNDLYIAPTENRTNNYGLYGYVMAQDNYKTSSRLFSSDSFNKIKCNSYSEVSDSDHLKITYSWNIDFNPSPDSIIIVRGSSSDLCKAFWNDFRDLTIIKTLSPDETSFFDNNATGSRWGGYSAIYARYGDYYVRVTGKK